MRQTLGMSATQLAKRLGISKQAVARIEKADRAGSLNLTTLQRIANALQCEVKIALVPKKPLEQLVRDQAYKMATQLVAHTELHMRLEKQGTKMAFQKKCIKQIAEDLILSRNKNLWQDF